MPADLTREYGELQALTRAYLDGMFYADEEKLRSAFHPKCIMFGHFNGRFEEGTVDDFVAEVKGLPIAPGTAYESSIASVEITGDIAIVKVTDTWAGSRFTDYLTMAKDKGAWRIINKAFYVDT
jgi:hypothetical protein